MKIKRCKRTTTAQFNHKTDAKAYAKACGGRISKQKSMIHGSPSTYYMVKKPKRRKK